MAKTIIFQENNILYMQDFSYYRGVPHGVEFTIEYITRDRVVLSAPGYGGKPYGNGKLYINRSQRMAKIYEDLWEKEHPGQPY